MKDLIILLTSVLDQPLNIIYHQDNLFICKTISVFDSKNKTDEHIINIETQNIFYLYLDLLNIKD